MAILLLACSTLSLWGGLGEHARADVPWPGPAQGQDPYAYQDYCRSDQLPADYSADDPDFWMYTSQKSGNPFIDGDPRELNGVMGAGIDRAWSITTGRPDVMIAVLDLGIRWDQAELIKDTRRKFYLNQGELPISKGYEPGASGVYDFNRDGVFNVDDYADAGDFKTRIPDANGNGVLDPQDIIWRFADGVDDNGNGHTDDISGWDFLEDDNDPWDEIGDGHGTDEARWAAAEANNEDGLPGACPNATLLAVRVGDANVVDMNNFAQSVVFAVDSGASVILEPLGGLSSNAFGQAAIDYAWSKGTVVMAAAPDEESAHQNYPTTYDHTVQVSAVTKYQNYGFFLLNQFPASYLYFGGRTNYGAHATVAVPSAGHSSGATGRGAGIAALLYSAAEDRVRRGEMSRYPGIDKPISAGEAKQLLTMTADDIDFSPDGYFTSLGLLGAFLGPSERFHSTPGWDPYFGYGRVNAYGAVKAVADGRIPPEAEITSPSWFAHLGDSGTLKVAGRVAAVRSSYFHYTVEYGPGWDPEEGDWTRVARGWYQKKPIEGVLATLDLAQVARRVRETVGSRGGEKDPNRYSFTVRVRAWDDRGVMGEDRKTLFCYRDPDAFPGAPRLMEGDVTSSMRFADIDDDGVDELVLATGGGLVHAYNSDFTEVKGWPVHVTPVAIHTGSPGYSSAALAKVMRDGVYACITASPAVGDLDRDGSLEVVVGDSAGRVYAWRKDGRMLPGFPVRSNPLYSIPDRADWWTPGALPAEYYQNRFVPDRIHRLDKWNSLDSAFMRGPALFNLDGSPDGSLEIISSCMDQHLYAWHLDGTPLAGWPVKLVDPGKVAQFDPVTHRCVFVDQQNVPRGGKIVDGPSVADLDGDGSPEVVCGTNEGYVETPNASVDTFGLTSLIRIFQPVVGDLLKPFNTRVYAVCRDGTLHPPDEGEPQPAADRVPANAYLKGWPVAIAMVFRSFPTVMEGVNGPAAIADVDGDGKMEVGVSSAFGPGYLLEPDGTSHFGVGSDGLARTLECDEFGTNAESTDGPLMCDLGGGCFVNLGSGGLSYAAPSMGLGRCIDMVFPEEQKKSDDQLSAWSTVSGALHDAFPRKVNDMMFFVSPAAADIDGDGSQEILAGSSFYDVHAIDGRGVEPGGWPKFSGGWMVGTPAVGDFDGDDGREVAAATREGWLFVWRTRAGVTGGADWPEYCHDPWATGCLSTDAVRPGRVSDFRAVLLGSARKPTGARLNWTAPGDDGRVGRTVAYDIRVSTRPIDAGNWKNATRVDGEPVPKQAGRQEQFIARRLPFERTDRKRSLYLGLQARDDAGNLSAISQIAKVDYGR
jgi:hypothetical protein